MFKKLFDVKKTVVPVSVREDHFAKTSADEVNATQTPVAWAEQTDYLILGKVRQIPSAQTIKRTTSSIEIYGEEGGK